MFCVDVEFKKRAPDIGGPKGLPVGDGVELIKKREKAHVYKVTVKPGETRDFDFDFFYVSIAMNEGQDVTVERGGRKWRQAIAAATAEWVNPGSNHKITNNGQKDFSLFLLIWQ